MPINNKRQSWIDVLKGIGIILVVFGHVYTENPISIWIYSFHMPLFFALSGYIYKYISSNREVNFKEFLFKKIKSLIIPFIIFRILLVIYWLVVERHFRALDLGPIWFLPVLFIAEIITHLICCGKRPLYNIICIILCAVVLYVLKQFSVDDYSLGDWIMISINGLAWYNSGVIIGYAAKAKPIKIPKPAAAAVTAILFAASVVLSRYNGMVSMYSSVFGNYFIYIIESVVGIFAAMLFCRYFFTSFKPLEYYGKYTIIILATHEPVKRVVLKITEIVFVKLGFNITTDFLQENILAGFLIVLVILIIEPAVIQVFRFIKSKSKGFFRTCLSFVS